MTTYGPGEGCAVSADLWNHQRDEERNSVDSNALQRELEERAEQEAEDGADVFREWLVENVTYNGGGCIALVLQAMDTRSDKRLNRAHYLDRVSDAADTLLRDYIQWRVEDADLREEVIREMLEDA